MTEKVVALGNFDGMHLGHIAVLDKALEAAKDGFSPYVLLFSQHSEKALFGSAPPMLMTHSERRAFIEAYGFGIAEIDFNRIKDMSPEEFIDKILIGEMNAKAVVSGYNYRFGKNASGDTDTLRQLCAKRGITCHTVSEVEQDGTAVSSTAIRRLIENGEIERANRMLARSFGFSAEVIHGDERGREWGFPTVNQLLPEGFVIPKFGVYASSVTVDGRTYRGITNIGRRPTVGTEILLSETHIIDFSEDVYGKEADIRLLSFMRPEHKFSSFDELKNQIKNDIANLKGSDGSV